jgi:site-specific DNA recombinase
VLEFNSLQAQEQICKTYIGMREADPASSERWMHAETYSDPGYSGGTLDRPALGRLLDQVEAGQVDTILVYKIDRLSRSIHQFYRIWEILVRHNVDLVSATQDLNTSTSQGKLMLNMLLSFGQFEREQISERTRDKVAAARKRGRWTGGMPILGYDIDPRGGRLAVNGTEAAMVREIFKLYETMPSLTRVVEELGRRGWRRKTWTLRSGLVRKGAAFDKPGLLHLLRNPLYCGKVPHRGTLYPGEHSAIIDETAWAQVQAKLSGNGSAGYQGERSNSDALLKGLLHCAHCGCAMTPTYTTRGNRRFRYYVCQTRLKKGAHACPTGRVAAHQIEQRVIEQIRSIGRDPELVAETVRQARVQLDELVTRLRVEEKTLRRGLRGKRVSLSQLQAKGRETVDLQAAQERIAAIEIRLRALPGEIEAAKRAATSEQGVRSALEAFGPVWEALWPMERSQYVGMLAKRIRYDGREKHIAIQFRTGGIGALAAGGTT